MNTKSIILYRQHLYESVQSKYFIKKKNQKVYFKNSKNFLLKMLCLYETEEKNKRDVGKYRQRTKPKQFNNKRLFI